MSSDIDTTKIKKQLLIRYPVTFYEEVSHMLAMYKSYRDNKKYFRALPVMDELIDYVSLDPETGKYWFEFDEKDPRPKESGTMELIQLPRKLIEDFKDAYHGTDEEYDEELGIKHLSPGTTVDDNKATVLIRKSIRFLSAYADHSPEWTALIAGFAYKISIPTPSGFPITETIPMVDAQDPNLQDTFTSEIPRIVWIQLFDNAWMIIGPICTRIERILAKRLEEKGFGKMSAEMTEMPEDGDNPVHEELPDGVQADDNEDLIL